MSSVQDIIAKWHKCIPVEADLNEVRNVIDFYFPGRCRQGNKSSHLIIQHDILKVLRTRTELPGVNHDGEFTVCHVNGRKVKGIYIQRLLYYGDLVKRIEDRKNET